MCAAAAVVERDNFIIHLFSNNSIELHKDNTLSLFTVEFDRLIELDERFNWRVGVSDLVLNHSASGQWLARNSRDMITLDAKQVKSFNVESGEALSDRLEFKDFNGFVRHLLENSIEPATYDSSYFARYIQAKALWSHELLAKFYRADNLAYSDEDSKTAVFHTFDIAGLFTEAEKNMSFPTVFGEHIEQLDRVDLELPTNRSITGLQAINLLIKEFLYKARQRTVSFEEHALLFFKFKYRFAPKVVNQKRREHAEFISELTRRFITKFIATVKEESLKLSPPLSENKFLMIYTDIVAPSLVGSSRHRIIFLHPFESNSNQSNLHVSPNIISFYPIEKTRFKTISIKITDESGEQISFLDSNIPNSIALAFERRPHNIDDMVQRVF